MRKYRDEEFKKAVKMGYVVKKENGEHELTEKGLDFVRHWMKEMPHMFTEIYISSEQTFCPFCMSDDIEETVTYPSGGGWDSPGTGGHVDCHCNNCDADYIREFGEGDIPDDSPI